MTRRKPTMVSKEDNPLNSDFETLVEETLTRWHVPGVAVAVMDGPNTYTKGYGIATLPSTPVTPSTLFYAGSTTKAFTAAIMSFLVDDNEKYPQLQWDTPINTLIRDDFVLSDEYATTHITVEDALSHRSGLPGHDSSLGGPGATVKSIVRDLRHLPMSAEPRTKYQYCNAMFIVASHVIQTVTGCQLGDLLRDWIWDPLGMDSTFFDLPSAKSSKEHLATGYRWLYHEEDGGFEDVGWMELDEFSGAGSIITNVLDYAKWARAIFTKTTPLSKSGFEQWFTPRIVLPAAEPFTGFKAYALGWSMGVYKGERFYEHSGSMKGFGAELLIFPDREFAVVCLANTGGTANFVDTRLAFHLMDEKLGVEKEERFDFDKGNQAIIDNGIHRAANAASIIYPHLPTEPLPLTLPLASYAGTYSHPAYKELVIYVDSSKSSNPPASSILKADRTRMTWANTLLFTHVSGNFFVARSKALVAFGALFDDVYPVEFRIDPNGSVGSVGVTWQDATGQGSMDVIWFSRVA